MGFYRISAEGKDIRTVEIADDADQMTLDQFKSALTSRKYTVTIDNQEAKGAEIDDIVANLGRKGMAVRVAGQPAGPDTVMRDGDLIVMANPQKGGGR